jgi:hypothetical protein
VTLASAFVARWCVAAKAETAGGVFHVREDEPVPRVRGGAAPDAVTGPTQLQERQSKVCESKKQPQESPIFCGYARTFRPTVRSLDHQCTV